MIDDYFESEDYRTRNDRFKGGAAWPARPVEKQYYRENAAHHGEAATYFWLRSYLSIYSEGARKRHLDPIIDLLVYGLVEEKTR